MKQPSADTEGQKSNDHGDHTPPKGDLVAALAREADRYFGRVWRGPDRYHALGYLIGRLGGAQGAGHREALERMNAYRCEPPLTARELALIVDLVGPAIARLAGGLGL